MKENRESWGEEGDFISAHVRSELEPNQQQCIGQASTKINAFTLHSDSQSVTKFIISGAYEHSLAWCSSTDERLGSSIKYTEVDVVGT